MFSLPFAKDGLLERSGGWEERALSKPQGCFSFLCFEGGGNLFIFLVYFSGRRAPPLRPPGLKCQGEAETSPTSLGPFVMRFYGLYSFQIPPCWLRRDEQKGPAPHLGAQEKLWG